MPNGRARLLLALLIAISLSAFSAGCRPGVDDEEDVETGGETAETANLTPYKPTGQEGTVTGTVKFEGPVPPKKPISMDADPVCASSNPNAVAEDLVVNGDNLENVFIYVKDGKTADQKSISNLSFDVPAEPKVLDQQGCHYKPHVIGVQTRQTINVLNSDPTSHNVNVQAKKNEQFNQGQGPSAAPIVKQFQRSEVLIPVKCNQHPWMRAYIGVLSHPFYSVSGQDGKFEIKNLPPGTYTLVAWHERLGEKTQQVTVAANGSVQQDFSFAASGATAEVRGGSLELMPAIEIPLLGRHQH